MAWFVELYAIGRNRKLLLPDRRRGHSDVLPFHYQAAPRRRFTSKPRLERPYLSEPSQWVPVGYHRGIQFSMQNHEGKPVSEVNVVVSPQQVAQEFRMQRPLRVALFGFGTVGSSVARILVDSKPDGLELTHVFNRGVARKRVDWVPESVEIGRASV